MFTSTERTGDKKSEEVQPMSSFFLSALLINVCSHGFFLDSQGRLASLVRPPKEGRVYKHTVRACFPCACHLVIVMLVLLQ